MSKSDSDNGNAPAQPFEARLIVDPNAIADLDVTALPNEHLRVSGLFLKRYNDTLPLRAFGDSAFAPPTLAAATPVTKTFRLSATDSIECPVVPIQITDATAMRVLDIPLTSDAMPPNYFNIRVEPRAGCGVELLSLGRASTLMTVSTGDDSQEVIVTNTDQRASLGVGGHLVLACRCDAYAFYLMLKLVECSDSTLELSLKRRGDEVVLTIPPFAATSALLTAFAYPSPTERLFNGHQTVGLAPAGMVIAVHEPFADRLLGWGVCAIADPKQIPLASPATKRPRRYVPSLLLGGPTGWLMAQRMFKLLVRECPRVVMVGNPPAILVKDVLEGMKLRFLGLVSGNRAHLEQVLQALDLAGPAPSEGETATYMHQGCHLRVLTLEHPANNSRVLEDFFIAASHAGTTSSLMTQLQRAHLAARLPAIPHCADLAIGIVSLLINAVRGRMPDDNGSEVPEYHRFADANLWLAPWREPEDADSLLVELNLRLVSETMAVCAHRDAELTVGDQPPEAELEGHCRRYLRLWLAEGTTSVEARAEQKRLQNYVAAHRPLPKDITRCLAVASYELCTQTGEYAGYDAVEQHQSFANPLVLVLAGGGESALDANLALSAPHWALYASGIAGPIGSAIAPTLLPAHFVSALTQDLRELRLSAYAAPPDADTIFQLRGRLGETLRKSLRVSATTLLNRLAPSRVVTFSDVPLDLLPFRGTVLGLEVPVARLPAYFAYAIVNNMIVASNHTLKHPSRDIAALVIPPVVTDAPTRWANKLSDPLVPMLERFGGKVRQPAHAAATEEEILDACEGMPIIIFAGHAVASQHWGGLELGSIRISAQSIAARDWTHSFVFLIGCETAAADTKKGDIAGAFIGAGARTVIGTLTKIDVEVAREFFSEIFDLLHQGVPADYAFFHARKRAVLFEALRSINGAEKASSQLSTLFGKGIGAPEVRIHNVLPALGISWPEIMQRAVTSLGLSLLGGVGERLV